MADGVKLAEPGTGTVIATDDVSGSHYQLIKLAYGALDAATLVTSTAGLPVSAPVGTPVFVRLSDGSAAIVTLPVSGTFWQTTQPVSLASLPALAAGSANIGDVDVLSLPALPAGTNAIGTVDLKANVGRTAINLYATNAAAGATTVETAITLTKSAGTGATSTGTSFVVTSGKKFRIQSIVFAARGHATATIQATTFSLRMNTGGAVTTTSTPVLVQARVATPATASAWDRLSVQIPDGLEITGDGTLQIGVTAVAVFTTNAPTWDVWIVGYEY
jgi:hypothetical protein